MLPAFENLVNLPAFEYQSITDVLSHQFVTTSVDDERLVKGPF